MRPLSLRMKNLYSHVDSFLNLRHKRLSMIVGEVDGVHGKSNKAGKTSIFRGIAFCLFGSKKARTVRDGEKEGKGTLVFRGDDGNIYKIERSIRLGKNDTTSADLAFYFKDGDSWARKTSELKKGATSVQDEIEKVVGMDADVFRQSVHLQASEIGAFAKANPSDRKKVFKKFIDLSHWDDLEEIAKKRTNETKEIIETEEKLVEDLAKRVEDPAPIKQKILELNLDISNKAEDKTKKLGKLAELASRLSKIGSTDELLKKAKSLKIDLQTARSLVLQLNNSIDSTKDSFRKEADEFKSRSSKEKELNDNIKFLSERIENIPSIEKSRKDIALEIAESRKKISAVDQEIAVSDALMANLLKQRDRIKDLENKCPTCLSDIHDTHKSKINEDLKAQYIASKNKKAVSKANKETLDLQFKSQIEKENELNEKFMVGFKQKNELDNAKSMLEKISSDRLRLKEKHLEVKTRIAQLEAQKTKAESSVLSIEPQLEAAEREFNVAIKDTENIASVRAEHSALTADILSIDEKLISSQKMIGEMNAKLAAAMRFQEELDSKRANIDNLRILLNVRKQIEKSFGKLGIQAIIIENSMNYFETTTRSFLKRFTGEKYDIKFETTVSNKTNDNIREVMDILIDKGNGVWHHYESFSGAETLHIDLAIRVGLAMMSASFSSVRPNYLYIDEIAGSLDPFGRKEFVEILVELAKDFDLILVVTHSPELQEEFRDIIKVKKTGYSSFIVDGDPPEGEDLLPNKIEKPKSEKKNSVKQSGTPSIRAISQSAVDIPDIDDNFYMNEDLL